MLNNLPQDNINNQMYGGLFAVFGRCMPVNKLTEQFKPKRGTNKKKCNFFFYKNCFMKKFGS